VAVESDSRPQFREQEFALVPSSLLTHRVVGSGCIRELEFELTHA
jgi:hypothetical protein